MLKKPRKRGTSDREGKAAEDRGFMAEGDRIDHEKQPLKYLQDKGEDFLVSNVFCHRDILTSFLEIKKSSPQAKKCLLPCPVSDCKKLSIY
jgi:hypothetical protein